MLARQIEKGNFPKRIAEQKAKAAKRAVTASERLKEKKAVSSSETANARQRVSQRP
jgi:hypothetical protein